jgi:hypothetical protein
MGCSLLIPPRVRRINYFLTTTESLPVVSVGSGPITQIIFILSAMDSIPSESITALMPTLRGAWYSAFQFLWDAVRMAFSQNRSLRFLPKVSIIDFLVS